MNTRKEAAKQVEELLGTMDDYKALFPEKPGKIMFWKKTKTEAANIYIKMINKRAKELDAEGRDIRKKDKPHVAKETVLVTDEANARLVACKVQDDHKINFEMREGRHKTKREVGILRAPHVLELPKSIMPNWLVRRLLPKTIRFRMYTVQKEGEITHDPHIDELDEGLKRRFEKVLQLEKTAAKTGFATGLMKGLKDKQSWMDYMPYFAIVIIVLLFILGYQVMPYM